MPAADISEVRVEFGNGIKREEYGPTKSAKVTLTAIVNAGEDGVIALEYISKIAQDKVRQMLGVGGSTEAATAATGSPAAPPPSETVSGEPNAPATRHRRTKAQIEADNAVAAEAAKAPSPNTSSGLPAAGDEIWAEPQPETQAETATTDEWDAGPTPEVTDQELNHACSVTAERVKDGLKVRATIALFNPGGDAFDPTKPGGRKFTVNDIPPAQRQAFLDKLKALT